MALYQIHVAAFDGIDIFTARPGGNPLGLVLSNAVYDGETNVVAIVVSSSYIFFATLELRKDLRRRVAMTFPLTLILVSFLANLVYVSFGVGLFCGLPCTSNGMSIVATSTMGFAFVLSIGGLKQVMGEFRRLGVSRLEGLGVSLLFAAYLFAFLVLLLDAFVSQHLGVAYVHYFGLVGGGVGAAITMLYQGGRRGVSPTFGQSHGLGQKIGKSDYEGVTEITPFLPRCHFGGLSSALSGHPDGDDETRDRDNLRCSPRNE